MESRGTSITHDISSQHRQDDVIYVAIDNVTFTLMTSQKGAGIELVTSSFLLSLPEKQRLDCKHK